MLTVDGMLDDPQLAASGVLHEYEHPSEGRVRFVGSGVAAASMPTGMRRPAPRLGEHSAEILRSIGRSDAEIESLAARGVTRLPPTVPGTRNPPQ
jgi:crotonobetainyl-CoA:carnitine CoA-transferase CaiB-like acyl-CoA transferase